MQEIFFTILIIWILFRIFGSGSGGRTVNYTQNNYQQQSTPKEGDTKITYIPKDDSQRSDQHGEYVDFEEIK